MVIQRRAVAANDRYTGPTDASCVHCLGRSHVQAGCGYVVAQGTAAAQSMTVNAVAVVLAICRASDSALVASVLAPQEEKREGRMLVSHLIPRQSRRRPF